MLRWDVLTFKFKPLWVKYLQDYRVLNYSGHTGSLLKNETTPVKMCAGYLVHSAKTFSVPQSELCFYHRSPKLERLEFYRLWLEPCVTKEGWNQMQSKDLMFKNKRLTMAKQARVKTRWAVQIIKQHPKRRPWIQRPKGAVRKTPEKRAGMKKTINWQRLNKTQDEIYRQHTR